MGQLLREHLEEFKQRILSQAMVPEKLLIPAKFLPSAIIDGWLDKFNPPQKIYVLLFTGRGKVYNYKREGNEILVKIKIINDGLLNGVIYEVRLS